jgi:cyclic beta-1,2-glucan synthetase
LRARLAMDAVDEQLVRRGEGLALLFTPPFEGGIGDPGYLAGYPPGLRENGGQYSHAAMWAILAFAKLGDGARAAELFALVNPIRHASTPDEVQRYRVEPYVVAADVYSVAPHVGRGGWTWYTGAAGWMYRAGLEGILGLRKEGAALVLQPSLPPGWPGFEASVQQGATRYELRVTLVPAQVPLAWLDDVALPVGPEGLRLPLDGGVHQLRLAWCAAGKAPAPEPRDAVPAK